MIQSISYDYTYTYTYIIQLYHYFYIPSIVVIFIYVSYSYTICCFYISILYFRFPIVIYSYMSWYYIPPLSSYWYDITILILHLLSFPTWSHNRCNHFLIFCANNVKITFLMWNFNGCTISGYPLMPDIFTTIGGFFLSNFNILHQFLLVFLISTGFCFSRAHRNSILSRSHHISHLR